MSLEEEEWQSRSRSLSRVDVPEAIDDRGEEFLATPLIAGSRLRYRLQREAGESSRTWTVTLTGPLGLNDADHVYTATLKHRSDAASEAVNHSVKTTLFNGTFAVEDDAGNTETARARLPLGFFRSGLVVHPEGSQAAGARGDGEPGYTEREVVAIASLMSMSLVASENRLVRSLMLEVVQRPSLLKLLTSGFQVTLSSDLRKDEPVDTVWGPGVRIPIELLINGDSALVGTLTAVAPRGALELAAGIVEFVGFAPHRPDEVLRLSLTRALGPVAEADDGRHTKFIRAEYQIESR